MPPLSHLTACTSTKSNLYLANSLAAAVSEPDLYWLLTFQVPFPLLRSYQSISPGPRPSFWAIRNMILFRMSCWHLTQPPNWRTTHFRLYAAAYSTYSQVVSILEAVPPSGTWGRAMPWWQAPNYHGYIIDSRRKYFVARQQWKVK